MLKTLHISIVLIAFLVSPSSAKADSSTAPDFSGISIVTSIYPPYSYSSANGLEGIAVRKVERVLAQLHLDKTISIYPWARAYETARTTPNTLIFSMARSEEREHLFKWVGTIVDFNVKIYRLKSRKDIKIETVKDLKNYRIGALNKDIKGDYLRLQGIPIETLSSEESGIHMLYRNRIDMIPVDAQSFKYRATKLGYSTNEVEEVITLTDISRPLYLAFNKDTPDNVVEAFRQALLVVRNAIAEK